MKNTSFYSFIFTLLLILYFNSAVSQEKVSNTISAEEVEAGWELLFDGQSISKWRGLGRNFVPQNVWTVEDSSIKCVKGGGDLATIKTYANFEFYFEWKVKAGGNSGIKYNVSEDISVKHGNSNAALGFEYQCLDQNHEKYKDLSGKHHSGCLYDMIAPENSWIKPLDSFNTGRIIVNKNHVEHWLNEVKVVEYELNSQQLDSLFQKSKYKDIRDFISKKKGHIVLQNHGDVVWFRNLKIREL